MKSLYELFYFLLVGVCAILLFLVLILGSCGFFKENTIVDFERPYLAKQKCIDKYQDHIEEAVIEYCDRYWRNYVEN
jgi:hypothetical protein